jgi:hypothetical protein
VSLKKYDGRVHGVDLESGQNFRISTEYLNIASEYLKNTSQYKKRFGNADPMIVTPWWKKVTTRAKIFPVWRN